MSDRVISLLEKMVVEQERQTKILETMAEQQLLLIQALAEGDGPDPDVEPETYMDGSPCR